MIVQEVKHQIARLFLIAIFFSLSGCMTMLTPPIFNYEYVQSPLPDRQKVSFSNYSSFGGKYFYSNKSIAYFATDSNVTNGVQFYLDNIPNINLSESTRICVPVSLSGFIASTQLNKIQRIIPIFGGSASESIISQNRYRSFGFSFQLSPSIVFDLGADSIFLKATSIYSQEHDEYKDYRNTIEQESGLNNSKHGQSLLIYYNPGFQHRFSDSLAIDLALLVGTGYVDWPWTQDNHFALNISGTIRLENIFISTTYGLLHHADMGCTVGIGYMTKTF